MLYYTKKVQEDNVGFSYQIIRSKRKTVGLQIASDGRLIVRAPRLISKSEIDRVVQSHTEWIDSTRSRVFQQAESHPEPTAEERNALIARAKEEIPMLVNHFAPLVGVQPTGVSITSAKTRFGSCSSKNRLSFSWRLMQYPNAAIEYVVVHELCHILQHNHSAAFYSEVARVLPDHKERRKLLRQ